MLFSSIPFLYYFLPIVLILYFLAPKSVKNWVLLLASLVFYGWGEPRLVVLMLISITVGYVSGIIIDHFKKERFAGKPYAKISMIVAVAICLGFLGYFKYINFFISNISAVTGLDIKLLKVALPVGISFYTFQMVSYIIDVYWGDVKAQKNFVIVATYITMFPQLIAGPIVRYSDVEKQLQHRTITFDKIAYGIRRFAFGVGKKILVANVLGEFCAAFKDSKEQTVLFFWAYAIAVSLQIYFDFSGYSDMAIGLGSILGFKFIENFNYPFISKSATEFWRRWHMSLGTWFRDYVYIPLGGSRCSKFRSFVNIFIVWLLTGFWHGAEWTFIVWGLYFGVLLILDKRVLLKWLEKIPVLGHIYILLFGIISFVIFDATSLGAGVEHIVAMFGGKGLPVINGETLYYFGSYWIIFVIAIIGATPLPKKIVAKITNNKVCGNIVSVLEPIAMIAILAVATAYLVDGSFNPFLYFRF